MVPLLAVSAGAVPVHDIRVCPSIKKRLPVRTVLLIMLLLFCIGLQQSAGAQRPGMSVPIANAPLGIDQVVENLVRMNLERAQALHAYHGTRIYRVDYRGFPGTRNAGDGCGRKVPITRNEGIHDPVCTDPRLSSTRYSRSSCRLKRTGWPRRPKAASL